MSRRILHHWCRALNADLSVDDDPDKSKRKESSQTDALSLKIDLAVSQVL